MLNRDVEDDEDDGGTEKKIKIFSRYMSFISCGWRILLAIVLWKDSMDFIAIVKEKEVEDDGRLTMTEDIEKIIEDHKKGKYHGIDRNSELEDNEQGHRYNNWTNHKENQGDHQAQ